MGCERLELVRRGHERQPRDLRNVLRHAFGKAWLCVETCTHGCAALREGVDIVERRAHPLDPLLDLERVTTEFLAEGQRRRILSMGAPDLDDVLEGLRLRSERCVELFKPGDENRGRGDGG